MARVREVLLQVGSTVRGPPRRPCESGRTSPPGNSASTSREQSKRATHTASQKERQQGACAPLQPSRKALPPTSVFATPAARGTHPRRPRHAAPSSVHQRLCSPRGCAAKRAFTAPARRCRAASRDDAAPQGARQLLGSERSSGRTQRTPCGAWCAQWPAARAHAGAPGCAAATSACAHLPCCCGGCSRRPHASGDSPPSITPLLHPNGPRRLRATRALQETFYEYLRAQGDTLVVVDFYTAL